MENNPTSVINLDMPSFITYDSILTIFLIRPTNPATDLGIFSIKGEVTDSQLSTEFSFKINVYNSPPTMKDTIPDFTLFLGSLLNYRLPAIEDDEGLPIKIQP
jgi:hypothetical protein